MSSPTPERVPSRGIVVIAIILIALALVALYANVQKSRRDKIETVTVVTPVATPIPSLATLETSLFVCRGIFAKRRKISRLRFAANDYKNAPCHHATTPAGRAFASNNGKQLRSN